MNIELPVWFGGLPSSMEGGPSVFGGYELLLTGIAVVIVFLILGPRWVRDQRSRKTGTRTSGTEGQAENDAEQQGVGLDLAGDAGDV
jgi:hypothetical protein